MLRLSMKQHLMSRDSLLAVLAAAHADFAAVEFPDATKRAARLAELKAAEADVVAHLAAVDAPRADAEAAAAI